MRFLRQFCKFSFLSILLVLSNATSTQAEPALIFRPILNDIQRKLPNGLQMRLPAYLPQDAVSLYPFIKTDSKSLQVYLSPETNCKQPKCSIGGIGAFTQEGFSYWSRQLDKAIPINLPNGIQGYYLTLGKGNELDHYVLWQQDGVGFVLGSDRRNVSQEEMVQIAASAVVEPPLVKSIQKTDVLIQIEPDAAKTSPVTRPFLRQPDL